MARFVVTQANAVPDIGEYSEDSYIVDTTGYISAENQLKRFMASGANLDVYRKMLLASGGYDAMFDEAQGDLFDSVPDEVIDIVDAQRAAENIAKNVAKRASSSKSKNLKTDERSQKSDGSSNSGLDAVGNPPVEQFPEKK